MNCVRKPCSTCELTEKTSRYRRLRLEGRVARDMCQFSHVNESWEHFGRICVPSNIVLGQE